MSRRIAVVTGSRAEFGLLRSVMASVDAHEELELQVVVAGAHLVAPASTAREVREAFPVAFEVPMQAQGEHGRAADARSLARGMGGFARAFDRLEPDMVVVLGDRIEAFAAASVAAVGGIGLAHLHGGDRAEGVADEAMRHAITQLANVHLPATEESAERIRRLGQPGETVFRVGSPAVDDLASFEPLDDARFEALGSPRVVVLHHGCDLGDEAERAWIDAVLAAAVDRGPVLALRPNLDPGSDVVGDVIDRIGSGGSIHVADHLPRAVFVGLLRRVAVLVGNSSAGLIESAIVGCPSVDVGPRQSGRERPGSVVDVSEPGASAIGDAIDRAVGLGRSFDHPYGDPGVGDRVAGILAATPLPPGRKRLTH